MSKSALSQRLSFQLDLPIDIDSEFNESSTESSDVEDLSDDCEEISSPFRANEQRPVYKLTLGLLQTYQTINSVRFLF